MLKKFNPSKLCMPSWIYFLISMISVIVMVFQNISGNGLYKIGSYSCECENVTLVFLGKLVYIFLWTWILNYLCSKGFKNLSWFLVAFPFIMFFILIGMFMLGKIEDIL